MSNVEFSSLDFYDKLDFAYGIICSAIRGLKSIVNEYYARDYILEITITVEENFKCFLLDPDFNDASRFKSDYKHYKTTVKEILEICPLIRSNDADYHYLIYMLEDIGAIILNALPDNLRLTKFFLELFDNKEEISEKLNIDIQTLSGVLENFLKESDTINNILKSNKNKKR